MSARSVIVIGDKTTHGGTVLQGSQTMTAGGKNVARQGDLVSCPKCKGNFPIVVHLSCKLMDEVLPLKE